MNRLYTKFEILGDDHQALIWDVSSLPRPVEDPILAYQAGGEVINNYCVCIVYVSGKGYIYKCFFFTFSNTINC